MISQEDKVEYRDQDGNLLDEARVQELLAEGKASFQTKYETRTRLVDEHGNLLEEHGGDSNPSGVAPDHPDVEGQNPETKGVPGQRVNSSPAQAQAGGSVKDVDEGKAKPASDASAATK